MNRKRKTCTDSRSAGLHNSCTDIRFTIRKYELAIYCNRNNINIDYSFNSKYFRLFAWNKRRMVLNHTPVFIHHHGGSHCRSNDALLIRQYIAHRLYF